MGLPPDESAAETHSGPLAQSSSWRGLGSPGAPSGERAVARRRRLLFALFLGSGFCGLSYQVVWLRLAFASFGIVTPVLSVVVSVFMLGLALGSWMAGRWASSRTRGVGVPALVVYAIAEAFIGASAFAVPLLFKAGEELLLPLGGADSTSYLLLSALILALCLLPACIAMGATFPLMLAHVREFERDERNAFSFLYAANVIGAAAGVLLTATVLIELLGFRATLGVAAVVNGLVALTALAIARGGRRSALAAGDAAAPAPTRRSLPQTAGVGGARFALTLLFLTGFISMGFEVLWTRAFTALLGTLVYSFATLLFTYLMATWIGATLYRVHLARGRVRGIPVIIAGLAVACLLPVVLNDPRLVPHSPALVMPSIFPLCALLGYLTPMLIDAYSQGAPGRAGNAYAVNVLGCILGPLVACYLLLPTLGARFGMALLAAPFLVLLALVWRPLAAVGAWRLAAGLLAAALMACATLLNLSYEEGGAWKDAQVHRDYSGTVIAYGEGMDKHLLVNGVGMTVMTPVTKVMAHLPLAVRGQARSMLVICFGMGTTFRAALSWGVETTAVELCGPVPDAFPYYFDDARALLADPRGHIVIDDGRRYLRRSAASYDVITIDPPPPIEAAGSSLLYSRDFYTTLRQRLAQGGLLQQWCPSDDPLDVAAIARSLVASFPHVRAWRSVEGWGVHFLASMQPIEVPSAAVLLERMPAHARRDLVEWNPGALADPANFLTLVLSHELALAELLQPVASVAIDDDTPFTEYFLVRRYLLEPWAP